MKQARIFKKQIAGNSVHIGIPVNKQECLGKLLRKETSTVQLTFMTNTSSGAIILQKFLYKQCCQQFPQKNIACFIVIWISL